MTRPGMNDETRYRHSGENPMDYCTLMHERNQIDKLQALRYLGKVNERNVASSILIVHYRNDIFLVQMILYTFIKPGF